MSEYIISDKELLSIKNKCYEAGKHGSQAFTCRAPSEEIVRCRDCKHAAPHPTPDVLDCLRFVTWDYYNDEPGECIVDPDGFCSWGERR